MSMKLKTVLTSFLFSQKDAKNSRYIQKYSHNLVKSICQVSSKRQIDKS